MTPHLTPDQLDALLADPVTTHPHLATCARCREDFTTLQASFADLRTALTNATGVPHDQASEASFIVGALPVRRRSRPLTWALATAALLLAGAILPALHHQHPAPAATILPNQDDDALLRGIDHDLATPLAPSLSPLAVDTPAASRP